MSEIEELRARIAKLEGEITWRIAEVEHWVQRYNGLEQWRIQTARFKAEAEAEIMRLRQELADARAAHATQVDIADEARAGWERDHAEIVRLRAALTDARYVLRDAVAAVPMMIDIMRTHGYVFERFPRNLTTDPPVSDGEKWEALAFSIYSELASLASKARQVLDDDEAALAPARQDARQYIACYWHKARGQDWCDCPHVAPARQDGQTP